MNKILTINEAAKLSKKLKNQNKTIVLVGGCFDILHSGHLHFLSKAKEAGDVLFLLLESDENVSRKKGKGRPVNNQKTRASLLSSLNSLDYIIPLKEMTNNKEYDRIVFQIKPNVIAQTKGDPNAAQRKKQCEKVGAKQKFVTEKLNNLSTTDLLKN